MKFTVISAVSVSLLLGACETTNLATNTGAPATIRQEFVRHSMMRKWEGAYVYGIGRTDLGFGDLGNRKGLTLTVDSGPSTLRVFYYAHRGGSDELFHQTDVISLAVSLKPNGRYTLHCDASEESARFSLIDIATNEVAAASAAEPLYIRPSPARRGPAIIPVIIPLHR